jgi:tetratricopeptide (TPR) repeat protein
MRLKPSILVLALSIYAPTCLADVNTPATQAVFTAYDKLIAAKPDDYNSLIGRANEYYKRAQYGKAANDLDKAIALTPKSDNLTLAKALCLRGNTAIALGEYAAAYPYYKRAINVFPELIETLPTQPSYLTARAATSAEDGYPTLAIADLVAAIKIAPDNDIPVNLLCDISRDSYDAVTTTLQGLMAGGEQAATFADAYGRVLMANNRYEEAERLYQSIIDRNLIDSHAMFANLAECQLNLARLDEAGINIDLGMAKKNGNTVHNFLLKSRVERARNNRSEALRFVRYAASVAPNDLQVRTQMWLCRIDNEEYAEVCDEIAEYSFDNPSLTMPYLFRAWLLNDYLKQPVAAARQYAAAARLTDDDSNNPESLHGFSLLYSGDRDGAIAWMDSILDTPDTNGRNHYLGACLYSAAGLKDRAIQCARTAISMGYGNLYDWLINNDLRINVAQLRDDATFLSLFSPR